MADSDSRLRGLRVTTGTPSAPGFAGGLVALLAAVWLPAVTLLAVSAQAQEISGLQAAAALEEVLIAAIAQSEKSVVAIARISRAEGEAAAPLELPQGAFGLQVQPGAMPGDPDFIPNDYATGVVVDRRGLILTAYHVLREHSEYYVTTSDRKTHRVTQVVGADPRSDLAVLAIAADSLTPIKFGDGSKVRKGQIVLALGNPYAIARDGQVSASWGIVSNLSRKDGPSPPDRDSPTFKPTLHQYGTLIQTDAKLNLGTSGGALVNLKGEMVGLTVSLAARLGYEQSAGYAIPVDETFRRALDSLKQGREVEYGLLGVNLRSLDPSERVKGKRGVRVDVVLEGTPAHRFGLQRGDYILQVGEHEIQDIDDLMLNVGKLPADGQVTLAIDRDGQTLVLNIQELSKYRVAGRKIVTTPAPPWRGIRVDYVTVARDFSTWAQQHRIDPHGAVLITEVDQDSPAWKEGLRPEMLISRVGNKSVKTPREFHEAVAGKRGPVELRLGEPNVDRPVRVIPPDAS